MILRDFFSVLQTKTTLEAVLLCGPRQVGKTTLLDRLELKSRLFFDDLSLRTRAAKDPAFLLENAELPCLLDEVQYAPQLFPEMKLRIDRLRRENLKRAAKPSQTLYYLTGSNRTLLDKNMKESLAGRCQLFSLHGLSIKEILNFSPATPLKSILFLGGLPDLYARQNLSPKEYLDSYILSFIEKDIATSSGIEKIAEFRTVLQLLAARTGQFIQFSEISKDSGVDQKTISSWVGLLERNMIVRMVSPFFSNLSKRIVKMQKLYFLDTGICGRLQSQSAEDTLWNSAQAGALFETLIFSEIIKTRDNFLKDWQIFTWRTKEKNEIDFILQTPQKTLFLEAKMGIQSAKPFSLDPEAKKVFKPPHLKWIVTAGGEEVPLDPETKAVPLQKLGMRLLKEI